MACAAAARSASSCRTLALSAAQSPAISPSPAPATPSDPSDAPAPPSRVDPADPPAPTADASSARLASDCASLSSSSFMACAAAARSASSCRTLALSVAQSPAISPSPVQATHSVPSLTSTSLTSLIDVSLVGNIFDSSPCSLSLFFSRFTCVTSSTRLDSVSTFAEICFS